MTEHANLAAALVPALAGLTVIEKGNTAKIVTKDKGSYSYSYADIADVVKLTRPVLAEHGIVALTPVHEHGSGLACTVVLLHTSGERLDFGPFPFPHGRDAQATGSMVTYHRRYALVSALGMAAGDDDDGAGAAPRQEAQQRPARSRPPQEVTDHEAAIYYAETGRLEPDEPVVEYASKEQVDAIKALTKELSDDQRKALVKGWVICDVELVKGGAIVATKAQADVVADNLREVLGVAPPAVEPEGDFDGSPF